MSDSNDDKEKKQEENWLIKFWRNNKAILFAGLFAGLSIGVPFMSDQVNDWKFITFVIWSYVALTILFISLIIKERNSNKVIENNRSLQEKNNELDANNVRLTTKKVELKSRLKLAEKKVDDLTRELESEDYKIAQHAFKIVNNHRDVSLILNQLRDLTARHINKKKNLDLNDSKQRQEYKAVIKESRETLKTICGKIARYVSKVNYLSDMEVTVSVFVASENLENPDIPIIKNFCSNTSTDMDDYEGLKVQGMEYVISENSDFHDICLNIQKRERNLFFCCNDLKQLNMFRDSNHKYLKKQDNLYMYKKGETEFILPYRALISSAIYDVNNTSEDVDKISGFLSISSNSYGCFNRSDTLIMQVIAAQLHSFCSNL